MAPCSYRCIESGIEISKVRSSLAGQPHHKREEGSGVMPISELYLLQPGVQPNQIIAPRHHQYYGAVPNAQADQSGTRSPCSIIIAMAVPTIRSDQPRSSVVLHMPHNS